MSHHTNEPWDTSYEIKTVVLLTLAFGLVGLDRWVVAPLFPAMIADLHLTYQDLGNVVGALGISWGAAAILIGGLSDRVGRRRVLIPAIVGFSRLSGLTGVTSGIGSLIAIRALMGMTEGAFCPGPIAAEAAPTGLVFVYCGPHHRGRRNLRRRGCPSDSG